MTSLGRRRMMLWMTAIAALLINVGLAVGDVHAAGHVRMRQGGYLRSGAGAALLLARVDRVPDRGRPGLLVVAFGLRAAWRRVRSTQRHGTSVSEGPPP